MAVAPKVHFISATIDRAEVIKYPVATDRRGIVILPIAAYIAYRKSEGRSDSSLESESRCLLDYCEYCALIGIDFRYPTEEILKQYFDGGAKAHASMVVPRRRDAIVYKDTITRKRDIIYKFYHVLQNRLNLISNVIAPLNASSLGTYRIRSKKVGIGIGVARFAGDNHNTRTALRSAKERRRRSKATPSPEQAKKIIGALLDRSNANRASTYYLAASLETFCGARACGVEDLTIESLFTAMMEETQLFQTLSPMANDPTSLAAKALADQNCRRTIVDALRAFKKSGRRYIFAMVIEKAKVRPLPISIRLAGEILDYIWSDRNDFIERRKATCLRDCKPDYAPPDNIFLSFKSGKALQAGSIGKAINKIFRIHGIKGSSHRLRATFAEEVVRDLYNKDRANNGGRVDFVSLIHLACEMLGHSNEKSIRKYINNIVKQERLFSGHVITVQNENDAEALSLLALRLDGDEGAEMRSALYRFLKSHGIALTSAKGSYVA
ncbi:site-specific integrase [Phyllobacterium lublinensis]|uniref:site-specific integrase n=1 Tax=Phyllobacterium lublinensis TaxID=2875708 RepID=UPI001CCDC803|nr:site-specific integrase [Phyllobacterium sp. 2063]MBZ9657241.1 site-specific integrase [Phyllobacterium sp. 2063]